ncbi:MAG: S-adenosylmethionine:tRNA ribosyltransferase-isomerase [Flavobacteriales bacterium]|jgi:S-adenosylmethionine:tRNA ribosyltransferase-isomerase
MRKEIEQIRISDYSFDLPDEKIAYKPALERNESKLLVYKESAISDRKFDELGSCLSEGDMLVYNNTHVIHARIKFERSTGARIEIFCLDPHSPHTHEESLASKTSVVWKCYVGNAKRWKGDILDEEGKRCGLKAELVGREADVFLVKFFWDDTDKSFAEVLAKVGALPLPPYIKREADDEDEDRYQTVYAKDSGSVAAPTAGLHFTKDVMASLERMGVSNAYLTLHVGAGTFKPVSSEIVGEHAMHGEVFNVNRSFIESLLVRRGRLIPVGTTSMRALESLYWIGLSISEMTPECIEIGQWTPYGSQEAKMTWQDSMKSVLGFMDIHGLDEIRATTSILIAPGYKVRMIDGLITNFHMPKSTLLLLVSALVGESWRSIYRHALDNDYRFLSYGDSSLLIAEK